MLNPEQVDRVEMLCWADHLARLAANGEQAARAQVAAGLSEAIQGILSAESAQWRQLAAGLIDDIVQARTMPSAEGLAAQLCRRLTSCGMGPQDIAELKPPGSTARAS